MKIWVPSAKQQRSTQKNYTEAIWIIWNYTLISSDHDCCDNRYQCTLPHNSFITSNVATESPGPYYHIALCTQYFSCIYVIVSMACIIKGFIVILKLIKVNLTWYTANIIALRATSKAAYTSTSQPGTHPKTHPTLVWVLLGVSHHLMVMRSGVWSTSHTGPAPSYPPT